jgi:hypothetical protein
MLFIHIGLDRKLRSADQSISSIKVAGDYGVFSDQGHTGLSGAWCVYNAPGDAVDSHVTHLHTHHVVWHKM